VKYVAKKMLLDTLNEKEKRGAMQEAELLKNLNHPNIVRYKESFVQGGVLIIVMEYCEVGDLSYHVKQKRSKG
jgi:NIMA (never in mitosis gene a)-related kinase